MPRANFSPGSERRWGDEGDASPFENEGDAPGKDESAERVRDLSRIPLFSGPQGKAKLAVSGALWSLSVPFGVHVSPPHASCSGRGWWGEISRRNNLQNSSHLLQSIILLPMETSEVSSSTHPVNLQC